MTYRVIKFVHPGIEVSATPRLAFHILGRGYDEEFWSDVIAGCSIRDNIKVLFSESSHFATYTPYAKCFPHESGPSQFVTEKISWESISALRNPELELDLMEILSGLKKLLDRRDFSGSFRNVDRDAYIRTRLLEYLQILQAEAVDGVICSSLPHNFESMCLYESARILGIPFLTFEESGIAPVDFPVTGVGVPGRMLYEGVSRSEGTKNTLEASFVVENCLIQELKRRSSAATLPSYIQAQRKQRSKNQLLIGILWRAQKRLLSFLSPISPEARLSASYSMPQHRWMPVRTRLLINYVSEVLTRLDLEKASKKATNSEKGLGIHYLFALGFEPESTTYPQGKPYYSQFDALLDIRRAVPKDEILWVKEHPSQHFRSMQGHLGSSILFIEAINRLENTKFLSEDIDIQEVFQSAKAVFTLTGTIAVEAVLRERGRIKVVSMGSPWWEGMPGTQKFSLDEPKIVSPAYLGEINQEDVYSFLIERFSKFGVASPFRGQFGSRHEDKTGVLYIAGVEAVVTAINDWMPTR